MVARRSPGQVVFDGNTRTEDYTPSPPRRTYVSNLEVFWIRPRRATGKIRPLSTEARRVLAPHEWPLELDATLAAAESNRLKVLLLLDGAGAMTVPEIAVQLDMPTGTVYKQIRKLRAAGDIRTVGYSPGPGNAMMWGVKR